MTRIPSATTASSVLSVSPVTLAPIRKSPPDPSVPFRCAKLACVSALALGLAMTSVPAIAQEAAETPAAAPDAAPTAGAAADESVLPEIEVIQSGEAPKPRKKYPAANKKSPPSPSAGNSVAKAQGQPAAGPSTGSSAAPNSDVAASEPASATPVATAPRAGTAAGDIVGSREGVLETAGSAHVVDGEDIYQSHVFTTNEALRKVPGVSVRDEEGLGIRPNIGIRGLNPTRSTKTLLLEDGLFLSYAPYGDNASYFHPSMDRFDHIEVMKGAEQILYGPQTISGTINYVTPDPPDTPGGFAALTGGNRDYFNGQVFYGGWFGNMGGFVDYVHKRGQGARDNTEHEIHDGGIKAIYQLSPGSSLIAKVSHYNEDSTVTYSGITDAERRNFGIRYNPFDNDKFDAERYGTSLRHRFDFSPDAGMTTSAYFNSFDRNWWRQASRTTDTQCGSGFRDDRLNGVAVDPDSCDSIQGRLREYYSWGVDQRFDVRQKFSENVRNEVKFGWRMHYENQDRIQINGLGPQDRPDFQTALLSGLLVEDNTRKTDAKSFFIQNKLDLGPFSITPALRYESIDNERVNNLATATCEDGSSGPCSGQSETSEVIPGITLAFAPSKTSSVFVGVHEGFAPSRVDDSITNAGGSIEVNSENSVNLEIGFKSDVMPGLKVDGTYFRNDFVNLVASGSVAGGDQPLAQGEALFEGFELSSRIDSSRLLATKWNLYAQAAWTWLWTAEQVDGFSCVDPLNTACIANGGFIQGVTAGNRLPYAAEHLLTARLGYATGNFDANIEVVYVGDQFGDFLNLESGADHPNGPDSTDALSGQFGEIPSFTVVNLGMTYTFEQSDTDVFFTVKNLFDEEYVVDRTRGILPGAPRLIHVGLKQNF